jgi:hypothetical protein
VHRNWVENSEGERQHETQKHAKEDDIKMDLNETGWGDVHWIHLAQDRDRCYATTNTVTSLRVL